METRVVNIKTEPCDVYIDRRGKWGNPFFMADESQRDDVCERHMEWIRTQPQLLDSLVELVGKRLGCWCKPKRCHGDNLIILMKERGLI